MDDELNFRIGSIAERQQLQQLGIRSYHQFSAILAPGNWATMDGFLHNDRMWDQLVGHSKIFVCEDGTRLVGMAFLVPAGHPTPIYPADWCYIRMVGVDPAYRGRGIARQLTQNCVDYAARSGEKIVGLHTSEKMEDARHIYESIGFTIHREIDPIYGMRYFLYKLELP